MSDAHKIHERPLSPHLQVYRLPYNAIMSISGRIVGIGLCLSLIALLSWFIAIVWNPALYDQTKELLDNPFTKYVFLLWAFFVFFYIGNGIRHVLWNIGVGLNQKAGIMSGNIVLLLSALLTIGLWCITCDNIAEKTPDSFAKTVTEEIIVQEEAVNVE
jgi:succinate dehydrogenase / fumarate reductase cytochrome b subunit